MSPEQACGHGGDARSDVWAFGCVVYEMLTGHEAFGRGTMADTFAAILDVPPDWTLLASDVPPGIRRLLRRCLERDPRQRLHHIADARIEIDDALTDPEASAAAVMAASRREREKRLRYAIAVLTVALFAALLGWFLRPAAVAELRVVEIMTPHASDLWSFALS